jgi:hypothetical protein
MEGRVKGKRAPEMEETGADDRTLLLTDGSWQSIHPFLKLGSPVSKKKVLAAFSEIPVELTAVEVTRDAQAEWGRESSYGDEISGSPSCTLPRCAEDSYLLGCTIAAAATNAPTPLPSYLCDSARIQDTIA